MFEILISLSASLEIRSRFYQNNGGVLSLPVFVCFSQLLLYRGNLICEEIFIVLLLFCCHFPLVFLEIIYWGNFYSYLYFNIFSWSPNKIIMQIYTQLCSHNIFLETHYPCFCHFPDSLRIALDFHFRSLLNLVVIPIFIGGV